MLAALVARKGTGADESVTAMANMLRELAGLCRSASVVTDRRDKENPVYKRIPIVPLQHQGVPSEGVRGESGELNRQERMEKKRDILYLL